MTIKGFFAILFLLMKLPIFRCALLYGIVTITSTSSYAVGAYVVSQPSTVFVSPNPSQVAGALRSGGFLSVAVFLALGATDYILDPNNHTVKIHKKVDTGIYEFSSLKLSANSAQEVCQRARDIVYKDHPNIKVTAKPSRPEYTIETSIVGNCIVTGKLNEYTTFTGNTMGAWTKNIKHQTTVVSIEQIAEQIIKKAQAGHQPSIDFLKTVTNVNAAKPTTPKPTQPKPVTPTKPVTPPAKPANPPKPVEPITSQHGNNSNPDSRIVKDWTDTAPRDAKGNRLDKCTWLAQNKHHYPADAVKATEKAWGCRRSRVSKDKK